jgi:oligopeptidase A
VRLPVSYLVCNQTPPVDGKPSLMTFNEVKTLFHEFGHGLQHMLTTVNYGLASGIRNVEWDAVELPSQFMENWCYHRDTLLGMSGHVDTGEPLPDDLYDKICAARNYRAGSMMLRQLYFAFLDLELHHTFDARGAESVFDVQQRIAQITTVLPPLPEDRFLCSFGHIFSGGYAAGYYSYKWAEVLSADAFAAFEEAGLEDAAAVAHTGRRYRNTILALGGSRHPMAVFRDFRGREPSTAALLRHAGLAA